MRSPVLAAYSLRVRRVDCLFLGDKIGGFMRFLFDLIAELLEKREKKEESLSEERKRLRQLIYYAGMCRQIKRATR